MNVAITKVAMKQKKKLTNNDNKLAKQLDIAIDRLPKGDIKKLKIGNNEYRLRVGEHRILFSKEKNNIIIHAIKDRKNSYKL